VPPRDITFSEKSIISNTRPSNYEKFILELISNLVGCGGMQCHRGLKINIFDILVIDLRGHSSFFDAKLTKNFFKIFKRRFFRVAFPSFKPVLSLKVKLECGLSKKKWDWKKFRGNWLSSLGSCRCNLNKSGSNNLCLINMKCILLVYWYPNWNLFCFCVFLKQNIRDNLTRLQGN